MSDIPRSEITPEYVFINRRQFMKGALTLAGAALLAACGPQGETSVPAAPAAPAVPAAPATPQSMPLKLPAVLSNAEPFASVKADELGDPLATYQQITNYNNFYEFSLDKEGIGDIAKNFKPMPWNVEVTGLVNKPRIFSMEEIYSTFPHEERVYRLRCVEAWSMVIPWIGFPMSALLTLVEPKPEAKFVKFTSVLRPEEMPGQRFPMLDWPYTEGLRLDEAMHPLAIFATGMYGKQLTNANGAPFRIVVPWKYGFKSIKSIVKVELIDYQPGSTWMKANGREYGFYANVNPTVDHPRWSQATERRIGERGRRQTLMYNGYEKEVAHLYQGMNLVENY